MDTQIPQYQESSPPSIPPVQPPKNKRWEIIIGIALILIIAGVSAYFLLGKNIQKPQGQNAPIPESSPAVERPTPQLNESQQIKNYTVHDAVNADFYRPYALNSRFQIIDEKIKLTNGVGVFSYCEGDYSCTYDKNKATKQATVIISNIAVPADPSFLQNLEWGGNDGVMILAFDFGNQAPKEYYLGTFQLSKPEGQNTYTLNTPPIKNLGVLQGTITKIDVTGKNEIAITLQTPSRNVNRTFSIVARSRGYDIVELTPDRSGKIYDDADLGFSFVYPADISTYFGRSMRNTWMETDLKVSPVYHAEACGLQPTFADSAVSFWSSNQQGGSVNLNANLTVHQIKSPTLYLTRALYGYDPTDWGKLKQQISSQDYVNNIKNGTSISERKITKENIQGYVVRHIAPFTAGRPCDAQYREQYQWVAGDLLFNLIFTDTTYGPASSNALKSKLMNSIFSSLKLK